MDNKLIFSYVYSETNQNNTILKSKIIRDAVEGLNKFYQIVFLVNEKTFRRKRVKWKEVISDVKLKSILNSLSPWEIKSQGGNEDYAQSRFINWVWENSPWITLPMLSTEPL